MATFIEYCGHRKRKVTNIENWYLNKLSLLWFMSLCGADLLEECGRVWNFRLERPWDIINRTYWTILVGAPKTRMLRKMWTVRVWLMGLLKGTRTHSTENSPRSHSCYILAKNGCVNVEFKGSGLIC